MIFSGGMIDFLRGSLYNIFGNFNKGGKPPFKERKISHDLQY